MRGHAYRLGQFIVIYVETNVLRQETNAQGGALQRAGDTHPQLAAVRVRAPLVRQPDGYTCGVAALQSVLHYYGIVVRYDALAATLGADPEQGTNYRRMVAYAQSCGLNVTCCTEMTLQQLYNEIDAGAPVIVALQAWGNGLANAYIDAWDDGHYAVVVGYDQDNVYLMDPSTLGNYTYIPTAEFLARWHDCYEEAGEMIRLNRFGMVFRGAKVCYSPEQILPMA
ncbi:MAG TPA: hypothetical protein DCL15_24310 [Chloroflexi bacterium]|nr:hypothetical protein [Chloroflexota bacterium]